MTPRKKTRLRGAPLADRIMFRVEFDTNGGCWLWSGATTRWGYGSIQMQAGTWLAHRASWRAFRSDPGRFHVLHHCDTPACVNPDHLFLGTNYDNVKDRVSKGRSSGGSLKGEAHPHAKLTAQDVARIRAMAASRVQPRQLIAAQYGIRPTHLSDILSGRRWSA